MNESYAEALVRRREYQRRWRADKPERDRRRADAEATMKRARAAGAPIGGGQSAISTLTDRAYPLICVCETPQPEWVYVAHQCATCKRVIQETTA